MNTFWSQYASLPASLRDISVSLVPALQILLIAVAAVLLQRLLRRVVQRVASRYRLPDEFNFGARRLLAFVVYGGAWLLALERLGVSGAVLWSAFTGFAAVAAVAFFAAWSVLSNIFCSLLIFTTGIFRLNDRIEVLENGEKAGLKGRVIDINLIYTTLEESGNGREGTQLKIPNSLLFQRILRQWRGPMPATVSVPARPFYETPAAAAATPVAAPDKPAAAPEKPPA